MLHITYKLQAAEHILKYYPHVLLKRALLTARTQHLMTHVVFFCHKCQKCDDVMKLFFFQSRNISKGFQNRKQDFGIRVRQIGRTGGGAGQGRAGRGRAGQGGAVNGVGLYNVERRDGLDMEDLKMALRDDSRGIWSKEK